jgi:peroxiredoxin
MIDKLVLPFDLLSDPEGEVAIKPLGFWDSPGRISKPALVLTDRVGTVRYIYVGRDFADRPREAAIMESLSRG